MSKRCVPIQAHPTFETVGGLESSGPLHAPVSGQIRKSRVGRWRALALLLVHLLVAVHVAHWWTTGSTMTPLEPSEAMEFSKHGLVNAGLIFFALTIASTLVLGRWFCGWACHVVALQDASRWLLLRLGIRPRAVNLGILGAVPWLAFAYMFLAPLVDRLIAGAPIGVTETALTCTDFWATFPSWPVALVTFLVCGFAAVYLLGAKAFCTYGCPYGGIFGAVDQLAPMRIRVTDACEGCGHCTAVCSSNVRVHQEVRDWKMVVDPGCMKCLDCISVCPKDALYVGFGAPAVLAKRRAGKRSASPGALAHRVLLAIFVVAALAVFELSGSPNPFDWRVVAALGLGSLIVLQLLRGKAERKSEHSLAEQALLGGFFLLAMLAFRGLHGWVPFLFALGLSAVFAWVAVQALRLAYRPNVALQRHPLRASGRMTRSGAVLLVSLVPIGLLGWHGGKLRLEGFEAARVERESHARHAQARESFNAGVTSYTAGRVDAAIADFQRALELDPGFLEARENLAGMLCASGRFAEGIREYEAALQVRADPATYVLLARACGAIGDLARARHALESALAIDARNAEAHALLGDLCAQTGDARCAEEHARAARELAPRPRQ